MPTIVACYVYIDSCLIIYHPHPEQHELEPSTSVRWWFFAPGV